MQYPKAAICFVFLLSSLSLWAQKNLIQYDTVNVNAQISFQFPDTSNNPYLAELRSLYALDKLVTSNSSDLEKILVVLNWTHNQWKHDGNNQPSKPDALTILKEAKEGENFRCVEYGIVVSRALLALNFKARVLGLKTKDVETTQSGAGHVLAEVWVPSFQKWALIDGQFNIMPVLDGIPLNAVELQEAISNKKNFKLVDANGEVNRRRRANYLSFIGDYLYYLDVKFDEREVKYQERLKLNDKIAIMLVPLGAKNPTIFQKNYSINYAYYTNSLKDFYKKPM